MCVSKQPWPLILICALLCPALLFSGTHSTPIELSQPPPPNPCAHESIVELIRKSPVIMKALGAHIFTDDASVEKLFAVLQAGAGTVGAGHGAVNGDLKWQNVQNNFFTSATLQTATGAATASSGVVEAHHQQRGLPQKQQSESEQRELEPEPEPLAGSRWQHKQSATTGSTGPASTRTATTTTTTTTTNSASALGDEPILITLTPEIIYKGASLLKITPNANAENAASGADTASGDGGDLGHGSGGRATTESKYRYEDQLNATLQPLSCFDGNLLKLLPMEVIVFGKLISLPQQQQQQQQQQLINDFHTTQQMDFLSISINGLHRWTPQFEKHIWKHLGWDDWSDFTLCSVTCGKGVQQRFRRCLLDNPMVNFNMQLNLNVATDDDDGDDVDDDDENVVNDDMLNTVGFEDTRFHLDNTLGGYNEKEKSDDGDDVIRNGENEEQHRKNQHRHKGGISNKNSDWSQPHNGNIANSNYGSTDTTRTVHSEPTTSNDYMDYMINMPHKFNSLSTQAGAASKLKVEEQVDEFKGENSMDNKESLRTFEGNKRINEDAFFGGNSNDMGTANEFDKTSTTNNVMRPQSSVSPKRRKHKRRKPTKNYSTMFCEGYNIEQRNCNIFECSDDISDLLKFYKKFPLPEDVPMQSSPVMLPAADSHTITTYTVGTFMASSGVTASSVSGTAMTVDFVGNATTTGAISTASNSSAFGSSSDTGSGTVSGASNGVSFILDAGATSASVVGNSLNNREMKSNAAAAATVANLPPSTTQANMGYVRSWRNTLNFTIMLTLRVRNDSKTAATIFSIRNATHNLYLESYKDGLRLYLERDSTTEMLPLIFNLYDYRWHQVAISIQNGDFISIYVDCSWTNSFIVSKRLYTLPSDADVEIGRGFNGELQQLLVMPDNQERQQCSNKRTSINEVKRYIIDTFIDDYGN